MQTPSFHGLWEQISKLLGCLTSSLSGASALVFLTFALLFLPMAKLDRAAWAGKTKLMTSWAGFMV